MQMVVEDDVPKFEIVLQSGDNDSITKALRRLPKEGGRIVLGNAVFLIHQPVVVDRDYVEIRGQGPGTVLHLTDGAACPVLVIGSEITPIPRIVHHVSIRHLVMDGNRKMQPQERWGGVSDSGGVSVMRNNGLTIRGATDIKVEHVIARNARSGGVVIEKGCREIYIDNLEASENHADGLACYETEDSYFNRLNLHRNKAAGLAMDVKFNHNVIKSAEIYRNGLQGIVMRDASNNDFKKILLSNNGNDGVFIGESESKTDSSCRNNVFSELTVRKNKGFGFRITGAASSQNLIRNSEFKENEAGNISQAQENLMAVQNVSGL